MLRTIDRARSGPRAMCHWQVQHSWSSSHDYDSAAGCADTHAHSKRLRREGGEGAGQPGI